MKRFFHRLCAALTPLCLAVQATVGFYALAVPSSYVVAQGQALTLPAPLTAESDSVPVAADYDATLKLLGVFPVKQVSVRQADNLQVLVGGTVFGMKLYTDGVLVVGLSDVDTASGAVNPAKQAGVKKGDVIEQIDGKSVSAKADVARAVEHSAGRVMTVRLRRDGVSFTARFAAVMSESEKQYKAGLWVRDSSAGLGTMTFYLPASGLFAGLGHPLCDTDTGERLPVATGEIVPARIYGITKGVVGDAGELCGGFDGRAFGALTLNCERGVYGTVSALPGGGELMEVAPRQEVQTGAAQIWCTLGNDGVQRYEVEIRRVRYNGEQDMTVVVTDPRLLERTGGIVQGM